MITLTNHHGRNCLHFAFFWYPMRESTPLIQYFAFFLKKKSGQSNGQTIKYTQSMELSGQKRIESSKCKPSKSDVYLSCPCAQQYLMYRVPKMDVQITNICRFDFVNEVRNKTYTHKMYFMQTNSILHTFSCLCVCAQESWFDFHLEPILLLLPHTRLNVCEFRLLFILNISL